MAKVELNTAAPAFALEDFGGEEVTLSTLLSEGHVVLVFNRGFT
jgi:peroxiredoxin